jgi:hypothetical protein
MPTAPAPAVASVGLHTECRTLGAEQFCITSSRPTIAGLAPGIAMGPMSEGEVDLADIADAAGVPLAALPGMLPALANNSICFTIHTSAGGWAGFAVSRDALPGRMDKAELYMAWSDGQGGALFSERAGNPAILPTPVREPTALQVPLLSAIAPAPEWAKISFSFCRPILANLSSVNPITPNATYLVAISTDAAPDPEAGDAVRLFAHSAYGSFSADFTSNTSLTDGTGGCVCVCFCLCFLSCSRAALLFVLASHASRASYAPPRTHTLPLAPGTTGSASEKKSAATRPALPTVLVLAAGCAGLLSSWFL